jgi:hypothetical protein
VHPDEIAASRRISDQIGLTATEKTGPNPDSVTDESSCVVDAILAKRATTLARLSVKACREVRLQHISG